MPTPDRNIKETIEDIGDILSVANKEGIATLETQIPYAWHTNFSSQIGMLGIKATWKRRP